MSLERNYLTLAIHASTHGVRRLAFGAEHRDESEPKRANMARYIGFLMPSLNGNNATLREKTPPR